MSSSEAALEAPGSAASAPAPRTPRAGWSLTGLVAWVLVVELLVNRIGAQVLRVDLLMSRTTGWVRAVDVAGLFFFELASALTVLVLGAGLFRVGTRGDEFRPAARASLPLLGGLFVALAGLGILLRLPPGLALHLRVSHLLLTLLVMIAGVTSRGPGRARGGVALLWLAMALRLVPAIVNRLPVGSELVPAAVEALQLGSTILLAVAGLLLVPSQPGRRGWAWGAMGATWLLVIVGALLFRFDPDDARRLFSYGLGFDLPVRPIGQLCLVAAVGALVYPMLRLLGLPGVQRLRGVGLGLFVLAGFALELPYQLAANVLAFLCLASSLARVDGPRLARADFLDLVKQLAARLGAAGASVTGTDGDETVRLGRSGPAGGARAELVLSRRQGALERLEVILGEVPAGHPPAFALVRRGTPRLGPVPDDARVAIDDDVFDRHFETWDRRGAGAPLLDDATRAALLVRLGGWLGVWPQRGVHYLEEGPPSDAPRLLALLALLEELQARTA